MERLSTSNSTSILVCNLTQKLHVAEGPGVTLTKTPLSCLNLATQNAFSLFMMFFCPWTGSDSSRLVELCGCLKSNRLIRKTPVLVIVTSWDRGLIERLCAVKVDWIHGAGPTDPQDPMAYQSALGVPGGISEAGTVLSRLCPFLNHDSVEDGVRLITCGAWRNRMVLGGDRLRKVCETFSHRDCAFFLDPRCSS
jgi:hypothetical protein